MSVAIDGISRESVAAVVTAARELVRQHEQRNESSRFITLGEFDALFNLKLAIRQTEARDA